MRYVYLSRLVLKGASLLLTVISLCGSGYAGVRIALEGTEPRLYDAQSGRNAQEAAGNLFRIQVEQVNEISTKNGPDIVVMLRAVVDDVERNSHPRMKGDVIYIRYRTRCGTGYEDASDPLIPEEGDSLPAFLNYIGADNHYVLAAGAFSFLLPENLKNMESTAISSKSKTNTAASKSTSNPQTNTSQVSEDWWNEPVGE